MTHRLVYAVLQFLGAILFLIALPSAAADYNLETVAENLPEPWSLAQLPDGSFLITQRGGEMIHLNADGEKTDIGGIPDTYYAGQGGFFDIVLHPDFASNQRVYLSYAAGDSSGNGTAIVAATLAGQTLTDVEQILIVDPLKDTPYHYGGKLLFLPDGTLLVTTGDGFEYREQSQNLDSELGKVLRINDDGTVPADNPFVDGSLPRVLTYGHRNPQGLALGGDGRIYLHEHGAQGGDEVNIIVPGTNYGWPAITYGVNYSGALVSPFTEAEGMQQPIVYWDPSIAPSGMVWYDGDDFPEWQGDLLIGTLVDQDVRRVQLDNGVVVGQESLFDELDERIRDVRMG
ncbi:MAG: PQQ-dependent sugar dehydrogenase, partial [Pseudomonadota bacterium]